MRRFFFVCTAFCFLLPTNLSASFDEGVTPDKLRPTATSFAYRAKHSAYALPAHELDALWFSGDDRELPRETVAEPIVEVPARAARPVPTRNALCTHAAAIAAEHDLPAPFFANLIQQESGFKSHVVSPAGAQGIAQFMPRVARAYGLENPFEPLHALAVSAKFLRELLGQFGNLGLAAAAYNAGPKRVQDWMARRGKLPEETRNYVRNITGHPAERWARVNAKTEETRLPPHARCPGMPMMEVSIPEAAPIKVAKGKSNAKVASKEAKSPSKDNSDKTAKAAAASKELPKLAAAKAAGPKMPKSRTLAVSSSAKKVAVVSSSTKVAAPRKDSKSPAGKKAAKVAGKGAKSKAKTAGRTATKVAGRSSAKTGKARAKSARSKNVKYADAR
jgi:hypothetical protein